jgi:hypothetical protein
VHSPQYTDFDRNYWTDFEDPPPQISASSEEFGQVHDNQVEHVQQPNQRPSTVSDVDWYKQLPLKKRPIPASSSEFGQADEYQVEHVQQSNQRPSTVSNVDWNRAWNNRFGSESLLPPKKRPKLASSKEFSQADENQVVHAQRPNPGMPSPGPSNPGPSNPGLSSLPGDEAVTLPSPNPVRRGYVCSDADPDPNMEHKVARRLVLAQRRLFGSASRELEKEACW